MLPTRSSDQPKEAVNGLTPSEPITSYEMDVLPTTFGERIRRGRLPGSPPETYRYAAPCTSPKQVVKSASLAALTVLTRSEAGERSGRGVSVPTFAEK